MFEGLSLPADYETLEAIEALQRQLTRMHAEVYADVFAGKPCTVNRFASKGILMVSIPSNYQWSRSDLADLQYCITRLTRIYANLKERQTLGLHGVMEV